MTSNPADAGRVHRDQEPTLEEIIRAKRPEPIQSVEDFIVPDMFESDDEVDEFIEFYRAERQASLG